MLNSCALAIITHILPLNGHDYTVSVNSTFLTLSIAVFFAMHSLGECGMLAGSGAKRKPRKLRQSLDIIGTLYTYAVNRLNVSPLLTVYKSLCIGLVVPLFVPEYLFGLLL